MRVPLIAGLLLLSACGAERYAGPNDNIKFSNMMDCRHQIWEDRGGPARAFLAGFGGALGGAAGGAIVGGATVTAGQYPTMYSDAVDQCMASRGYTALYPNPWDHH